MPTKLPTATNTVHATDMNTEKAIKFLGNSFRIMVENANRGEYWRNIGLGRIAFEMMCQLPDEIPGEYENPTEKAGILSMMLEQMDQLLSPRLCISVRNEIERLIPGDDANECELVMLSDFIDESLPMEAFCKKYGKHLLFDPVERTEEYENALQEVEAECDAALADHPRGMGFCFAYWSEKSRILAEHGIEWRSPAVMNPHVLFD